MPELNLTEPEWDLSGFYLKEGYTDHEWMLQEARKRAVIHRHENWKTEELVKKDIERRQETVRRMHKIQCEHIRSLNPDKTDMTFWLTRTGRDPKIGVTPEEDKAHRTKTTGEVECDKNMYHVKAREGNIYWPKKDQQLHLSINVKARNAEVTTKVGARGDRIFLSESNSLGSYKPDWKNFKF